MIGSKTIAGAAARALVVGAVAGGLAAVLAAVTLEPLTSGFGPWSRLWGLVSGTAAFGLTLLAKGPGRRAGALVASAAFGFVGLGVVYFMVGFGIPSLWSPEGLWMWPTAVGSLLVAGVLLLRVMAGPRAH